MEVLTGVEVFFTKRSLCDEGDLKVLNSHAIPDQMPFFVSTETLEYPLQLNAFLRQLPSSGAPSPLTWRAYAFDIGVWCRFLADLRGKRDVWSAVKEDAEVYYRSRRIVDPSTSVSAGTWNQQAGRLAKLYDYGIEEGLLTANPFRRSKVWSINGVETAADDKVIQERHAKQDSMRFHTLEEYTRLRDVGFRGLLPSGNKDPNYTPRDAERNVAFAELLVTTGMRVAEATALTRLELLVPKPKGYGRSVPISMAPSITKNNRSRTIFLPLRVQDQLRSYIEAEREMAVLKANEAGVYQGGEWVLVVSHDRTSFTTSEGKKVTWAKCTPALRQKLLEVRPGGARDPLWMWLSTNGKPVAVTAWKMQFVAAVKRCKAQGVDLDSSPHKLRHTFAVHMLNLLERRRVGPEQFQGTKQFSGNSLRMVQLLLGHASIDTTTSFYLGTADLMSSLLDDSAGDYADYLEKIVDL